MGKFGEIVNSEVPVLIAFYGHDGDEKLHSVLRDVAAAFPFNTEEQEAKVIKIDIHKNETLVNALRIKTTMTYFIYKQGEMKWRQSGDYSSEELIKQLKYYVNE